MVYVPYWQNSIRAERTEGGRAMRARGTERLRLINQWCASRLILCVDHTRCFDGKTESNFGVVVCRRLPLEGSEYILGWGCGQTRKTRRIQVRGTSKSRVMTCVQRPSPQDRKPEKNQDIGLNVGIFSMKSFRH